MLELVFATIMNFALANPELCAFAGIFLINLALGYKSQADEWCEANPRRAALAKTLRSVVDPWKLLQAWSLALHKKLPAKK